jgi:hypothetical protein
METIKDHAQNLRDFIMNSLYGNTKTPLRNDSFNRIAVTYQSDI